jgi:hypothetical protein
MAIMPMRSTAAAARTAASHGMDMRMVQPSPEMLESVAPPDVTIRSSASRSIAKSRASPQMRPVETTTCTPASLARRTASVVVSATLFCGVSAVPSRSSAISLILFICLSPFFCMRRVLPAGQTTASAGPVCAARRYFSILYQNTAAVNKLQELRCKKPASL